MAVEVDSNAVSPKRVLISYSHESEEHRTRIRRLADQLRADGIDAMIDQYDPHPPEGWPLWMERQINGADFVLVVCTETYWRRAEGHEQPGRGLGVAWEADLIREALYDQPHENTRFIPILFCATDECFVMQKLKSGTRYVLDEHALDAMSASNGYGLLYRHITNQPLVMKPPLGRPIKLDPINTPVAPSTAPSIPSAETAQPQPEPNQTEPSKPAAPKGVVLMAEARPDVKSYADHFTRFLRESGYEVIVPEAFSIERDIRDHFIAALQECLLVVQVLGMDPFPRSSFLESRYEDWQWQQARQVQKSVLRWRPPSLDISKIVEPDYRQLLDQDVVKCDAEDFKTTVLKDRLAELTVKPRPPGQNLFVHHHTKDADSADEVGGTIEDLAYEIKVSLTDERRDVSESIGSDPVHGLMVIYGDCGEAWIEQSLESLKKATDAANIRHNLKPPPRAIVKAKPEVPPLRRRPPRWKEIAANDRSALANFVRQVQGGEARP